MIILFISIISFILALLHFAVYKMIVSIFVLSSAGHLVIAIILTMLGLSFILASILTFNYNNLLVRIYYTLSAVWLGLIVYLFLASCVYALFLETIQIFNINISTESFGILCLIFVIIVGTYGLIHARLILVKNIQVVLPNLPTFWQGKKAVCISDLHLGAIHGQKFVRNIVSKINKINPDMVFIGGDLYDGVKVNESEIIKPLADLHPTLGTYFITGNHEEFRDDRKYLESIKNIGIQVLNNEIVTIDGLQLIGVDDRDSINAIKFKTILSNLNIDKNKPAILLKHQPSQLNIAENVGVSLQISGHTHRAQIFPLNIFTHLIFKGYDYGLRRWNKMIVYTSSGVGTWGPPMRIGSDSEIMVFEFK
jgi:predicted MPP superfamily phosphohydrolase